MTTPRLLTQRDVCERLGISRMTLFTWRQEGRFATEIKLGSHIRWDPADLERWLQDQRVSRQPNTGDESGSS